jgi:hypothetical protein
VYGGLRADAAVAFGACGNAAGVLGAEAGEVGACAEGVVEVAKRPKKKKAIVFAEDMATEMVAQGVSEAGELAQRD